MTPMTIPNQNAMIPKTGHLHHRQKSWNFRARWDTDHQDHQTHPQETQEIAEKSISIEFLQAAAEFDILFQFCYLCIKEKIKSISYSIQETQDTIDWQQELEKKFLCPKRPQNNLYQQPSNSRRSNSIDEDDLTVDSTLSLKDRHMIHTLLKISENLDQTP